MYFRFLKKHFKILNYFIFSLILQTFKEKILVFCTSSLEVY